MSRVVRIVAALALVSGLAVATSAAPASAGASQSLFVVNVVVNGTPPPGAEILMLTDATVEESREHPLLLSNINPSGPEVVVEVGTISRVFYVAPGQDAGAAAIDYECAISVPDQPADKRTFCEERTTPTAQAEGAPAYAYAEFWGNINQHANVTITLTFGTCNGRAVTTFVSEGDQPTAGNDVILGTPAGETINGHGGADHICGGGGPDLLRGGEGRDQLLGGGGNDRLEGGALGDTLFGGAGADTLLGLAGNDALDGGALRDTCNGGTERDTGVRCEVRNGIP
jgi:hypothetical protein